jgi:hypothetical protein
MWLAGTAELHSGFQASGRGAWPWVCADVQSARGQSRRFAAAVAGARRLPCGARSCGAPRNSLRALRALRSNRRGESDVEARCARPPQALRSSARQRRAETGPVPLARPIPGGRGVVSAWVNWFVVRQLGSTEAAWGRWGDFCGAEERSTEGGARSAHRGLTHRVCLSGAPAGRAASYAMRPRCEHRREVGPQGRPPQHEPQWPQAVAVRALPTDAT